MAAGRGSSPSWSWSWALRVPWSCRPPGPSGPPRAWSPWSFPSWPGVLLRSPLPLLPQPCPTLPLHRPLLGLSEGQGGLEGVRLGWVAVDPKGLGVPAPLVRVAHRVHPERGPIALDLLVQGDPHHASPRAPHRGPP